MREREHVLFYKGKNFDVGEERPFGKSTESTPNKNCDETDDGAGRGNAFQHEGSLTKSLTKPKSSLDLHYDSILGDISRVINEARKSAARSVNCIMTAAYWLIGRRIVESEQKGEKRAVYGEELLERLSADLSKRYGRGFGVDNLQRFRLFYRVYPPERIYATA